MISTILLSGGIGSRTGKDIPKQYCELLGKKIINYCIESIVESGLLDELIIVYGEGFKDLLEEIIIPYKESFKSVKLVIGGETRQDSVLNGLRASTGESVLLHEAARPMITGSDIKSVIDSNYEAVTMGCEIPFTVLKSDQGEICEVLNRNELVNIQLPQKFPRKELLEAHMKASRANRFFTDDSSLFFHYNGKVGVIKGSQNNIKITDSKDFYIAEDILRRRCGNRGS